MPAPAIFTLRSDQLHSLHSRVFEETRPPLHRLRRRVLVCHRDISSTYGLCHGLMLMVVCKCINLVISVCWPSMHNFNVLSLEPYLVQRPLIVFLIIAVSEQCIVTLIL